MNYFQAKGEIYSSDIFQIGTINYRRPVQFIIYSLLFKFVLLLLLLLLFWRNGGIGEIRNVFSHFSFCLNWIEMEEEAKLKEIAQWLCCQIDFEMIPPLPKWILYTQRHQRWWKLPLFLCNEKILTGCWNLISYFNNKSLRFRLRLRPPPLSLSLPLWISINIFL